jgi:hypothetical protein
MNGTGPLRGTRPLSLTGPLNPAHLPAGPAQAPHAPQAKAGTGGLGQDHGQVHTPELHPESGSNDLQDIEVPTPPGGWSTGQIIGTGTALVAGGVEALGLYQKITANAQKTMDAVNQLRAANGQPEGGAGKPDGKQPGTVNRGISLAQNAMRTREDGMRFLGDLAQGNFAKAAEDGLATMKDGLGTVQDASGLRQNLRGGDQAPSKLSARLGQIGKGVDVAKGVNAALNLRGDVERASAAFRQGDYAAAAKESTKTLADGLNVLNGSKTALAMVSTAGVVAANAPRLASLAGKLSGFLNRIPGLNLITAGADGVARTMDMAQNWDKMAGKDRVANIAGTVGDVATVLAATTPPPIDIVAGGVAAGAAVVSLAAENWDKVSAAASTVEHAAGEAASAVADGAKKLWHGLFG